MSDAAANPSQPPTPPRLLSGRIGRYDIQQPLGKGAMGVVYLALDTVLERQVALKVMSPAVADDAELKQRFEREAKAIARMTHPNVVSVFDLGEHADGSLYIAMELLKGQDLQKAMRMGPPLSLDRKVAVLLHVLAGLHHAHQAGIVHRDVKPGNIFLNDDGGVKIMDFGVARLTSAAMTGTGSVVGTADYMSPEQVKGARVDGRSDLFSVGAVLFELLSGRRPFHADNMMTIFYKITHDEPDYGVVPAGEAYDALLPVLKKALSKDLAARYTSAAAFAADLRAFLAAHATSNTGRHALETLDLAGPNPATLVDAETDGRCASSGTVAIKGPPPATLRGSTAATLTGGEAPTAQRRGASAPAPVPPPRLEPRPIKPAPRGRAALYGLLGAVVLGGAAGAWWFWGRPATAPPPTEEVVAPAAASPPVVGPPSTVLEAPPAEAAPVETAASEPPPTTAPASAAAVPSLRTAQAAFARGDYERALADAQAVLRADPRDREALALADKAESGRRARARVAAGEAALAQGDTDRAQSEADGARALAPWDERAGALAARVRDERQQAARQAEDAQKQQAAARLDALLKQADDALAARRFDEALGLYEQALALDPHNQRASLGRTGALAARAARSAPAGRTFVAGRTVARGSTSRTAGALPPGFSDSPEATVQRGSQQADLPGKIEFEVTPAAVKPGDRFTVRIALLNEGGAPIEVARMLVTTEVNGRKSSGPVTPTAKTVAPQQRAALHSASDLWSGDTTAWSMQVTVTTGRGETYSNQLTWK